MRSFLVCIHDATPFYTTEVERMLQDLAPLVGRSLSCGVVPDWHGQWPLASHARFCSMLNESAHELLLHGYTHQRTSGSGPVSLLAERSDEMNGLNREQTVRVFERAQSTFEQAFGRRARGFLPPAWQPGHFRDIAAHVPGFDYTLGFFSIDSATAGTVPLATFTWDCGRLSALGHVGHGIGRLLHTLYYGVPVLAIHPRDLQRGYWPKILKLTRELLDRGFQPVTPSALLAQQRREGHHAEIIVR